MLCYYKREVESRGKTFVMSNSVAENISLFVDRLTDYSNIYGVMLSGTTGNGKTTMVNAFYEICHYLEKKSKWYSEFYKVKIVNARELTSCYLEDRNKFNECVNSDILIIDDLGSEPYLVRAYGSDCSPIYDAIFERYSNAKFTIVTTNLTDESMYKHYPERFYDRTLEMFPLSKRVIFTENSYRNDELK